MKPRFAAEIEELVAAFYAVFDNRNGQSLAIEELHAMFVKDATITRVALDRVDTWTTEAFISPRVAMLSDGTLTEFREWEIDAKTTVFESIASRCSHYKKTGLLNGVRYDGGGRKFIQLCRTTDRWLISSILWEDA